jgi:Protein of unknown function DUF115
VKQTLKTVVPARIWGYGSDVYWWWRNRGRHILGKRFDTRWQNSQEKLACFKDKYAGRRCFVIGNGPSLQHTNLSLLENEITFGLNRIYLLFKELRFPTTFLVSVNDLVLEQVADDLQKINVPKFITWRARRWLQEDSNTIFIDTDFTGPENFSSNASGRIYEGFTVTFVALQLAFYMGFQQVILVGVDHNFSTKGPANSTVVSAGDDPNHFSASYFSKGFRWQLPDLEGSERAYHLARAAYLDAGREILDATVGGKLEIFPKVDFLSLYKNLPVSQDQLKASPSDRLHL